VALTVAGQWRTFTAFPSILAIAVISRAAIYKQPIRHETIFHDINIYNRRREPKSKTTRLYCQQRTLQMMQLSTDQRRPMRLAFIVLAAITIVSAVLWWIMLNAPPNVY